MENKYAIFVSIDKHFELKDPQKFKKKIEEIAKNNDENPIDIFKYYLQRHEMVEKMVKQKGLPRTKLDEMGDNMKEKLKKWIKEELK